MSLCRCPALNSSTMKYVPSTVKVTGEISIFPKHRTKQIRMCPVDFNMDAISGKHFTGNSFNSLAQLIPILNFSTVNNVFQKPSEKRIHRNQIWCMMVLGWLVTDNLLATMQKSVLRHVPVGSVSRLYVATLHFSRPVPSFLGMEFPDRCIGRGNSFPGSLVL